MATVYILNVWDETQGKYVGIPAIKGDKGDTPDVPIATETSLGSVMPVTKTDKMAQPVGVDQEGRLYVEMDDALWRYIGKFETAEDVSSLEITTDSGGNRLSLKQMRCIIHTHYPATQPTESGLPANGTRFNVYLNEATVDIGTLGNYKDYETEGLDSSSSLFYMNDAIYEIKSASDKWGSIFSRGLVYSGEPINNVVYPRIINPESPQTELGPAVITKIKLAAINPQVVSTGTRSFFIGAGTYIEIWGIDA